MTNRSNDEPNPISQQDRERSAIDAAFIGMESDTAYLNESAMLMAEFSEADWEAFCLGEDADES